MPMLRDFFQQPADIEHVGNDVPKPPTVPNPGRNISASVAALRSDAELQEFLFENKQQTAVVLFGASWCTKCHELFPSFYRLTKQHENFKYGVAQVDYMSNAAKHVRYTPTTVFQRGGRKVDEVIGKDLQRLSDHFWLQSDA